MKWFRYYKFTTGRSPYLFSLPRKYCLNTLQPDALSAVWLPSSTRSLSPLVLELLVPNPCVVSEKLSPALDY